MIMLLLLTILKMLLVRAEMMMIKTGESAVLECEGAWKYCEWKHHEQVSAVMQDPAFMTHDLSRNSLVTEP